MNALVAIAGIYLLGTALIIVATLIFSLVKGIKGNKKRMWISATEATANILAVGRIFGWW